MELKTKLYLTIFLILGLISCSEDATVALITVKNKSGIIQPDILVYEFEYPPTHQFGANANYANTHKITDKQGIARFDLQGYEFDEDRQQDTLHFTVFSSNASYTNVIGTIPVVCKKGETVSAVLTINE